MTLCWGIRQIVWVSTLGEVYAWFPPDFTPCAVPFADFAFFVLNCHEHHYRLGPMSPPSKWGAFLEDPNTPLIAALLKKCLGKEKIEERIGIWRPSGDSQ